LGKDTKHALHVPFPLYLKHQVASEPTSPLHVKQFLHERLFPFKDVPLPLILLAGLGLALLPIVSDLLELFEWL
jgi:hypothetical protein